MSIVVGHSRSDEVRKEAKASLNGHKVGLLFIDADRQDREIVAFYSDLLAKNCLLVLDDYKVLEPGNVKGIETKKWVVEAEIKGILQTFAVVNWGAWLAGSGTDKFRDDADSARGMRARSLISESRRVGWRVVWTGCCDVSTRTRHHNVLEFQAYEIEQFRQS